MRALSIIFLFSIPAFAQDWCAIDKNRPVTRIQLDGEPSWFISAHPEGRYVGVILNSNTLHDLEASKNSENGRAVYKHIPGSVDPVFTPDGKYLTLPGGEFYDAKELINNMTGNRDFIGARPVGNIDHQTPYQSIGVLKGDAQKSTYMYISDVKENSSQADLDFTIATMDHQRKKLRVIKRGVLCPGMEGHTPMISTDGKYLSILNVETKSTQIYRVGAEGAECKLVADLGVPTGKVSFDYGKDKRKLTFHVDRHSTTLNWFSSITGGKTKDSYVMDLDVKDEGKDSETWEIKGMQRLNISEDNATGTYYPRFRKDGTIVAITVENFERKLGDGSSYEDTGYFLDVFDPSKGKYDKNYNVQNLLDSCEEGKLENSAFAPLAIAYLWKNVCSKSGMEDRYRDSLLIAPALNKKACHALIDKYWNEMKEDFLESSVVMDRYDNRWGSYTANKAEKGEVKDLFSEVALGFGPEELKAGCSEEDREIEKEVNHSTPTYAATVQRTPEQSFMSSCGGCHNASFAAGGHQFVTNNEVNHGANGVNEASVEKALNAIWNSQARIQMPPSQPLSSDEKQRISQYLIESLPADKQQEMKRKFEDYGAYLK